MKKKYSSQIHTESVIHHLYMMIWDIEDEKIINMLSSIIDNVKELHQEVKANKINYQKEKEFEQIKSKRTPDRTFEKKNSKNPGKL